MWKNKHVIAAMLVAPVLALIAYFAVDYFVSERPHAAKPGVDYPLVARSNCRYASGSCDLVNGEFKLTIRATPERRGSLALTLQSHFPLVGASIGLASAPGAESRPTALSADDAERRAWSGVVAEPSSEQATLQIVAVAGESRYFAEVPTVFLIAEEQTFAR